MEDYLAGGKLPDDEQLRALLENIALKALLGLAGSAGKDLLRAMTLFRLPIPRVVAEGLAEEIGGRIQDLIDLALLEPGEDPVRPEPQPGLQSEPSALRISPLAASRLPPLTAREREQLAAIAAGPLFAAWGGETGERPFAADLQLVELALAAEEAPAEHAPIAAACGAGAVLALETTRDGDKPANRWTDFEQLVERAQDLIVLFGQVAPEWVRSRVECAFKVAAAQVGETNLLETIWVLLLPNCPGSNALPSLPRLIRVQVLDNTGTPTIAEATVEQVLRGSGAGAEGGTP